MMGCNSASDSKTTIEKHNKLSYINHVNKLEFISVDDKCGEWGGDEKRITVYRDDSKGPLLADYLETTKNCGTGEKPNITKSKKRINLTDQENDLIIECINELSNEKIRREDYPAHSGIFNQVMLSDSSMIIHDFPSVEWTKFNELVAKLQSE